MENLFWILIKHSRSTNMSAISNKPKKSSGKKNFALISGVLAAIGISLFAYLMWYVAPDEVIERVEIIAVTNGECIGQTMDGFPVNLGECNAEAGDMILAPIDQKVKERQELMNPTGH